MAHKETADHTKAAMSYQATSETAGFPQGRVLVVDDEDDLRLAFREYLEKDGHRVQEARNGQEALEMARANRPDAVLLDLVMPGMDGFAVCRKMKADRNLAHIPVIMVTALSQREKRLAGIDAGANDFLLKPVDIPDMRLRIRNAIHHKQLYDRLQENNRELQQLERLRDDLTHMVVHDMRSPLAVLIGYLDALIGGAVSPESAEGERCLKQAHGNARQLDRMIGSLLEVHRLEAGEMPLHPQIIDLPALVDKVLDDLKILANSHRCINHRGESPIPVEADADLIERVLSNLLGNAMKYTPKGGVIEIKTTVSNGKVMVSVSDTGPGIRARDRETIFEKFRQVGNRGTYGSSGLGLTFCRLAVERHGGTIGVNHRPGGGSVFWFTLPGKR